MIENIKFINIYYLVIKVLLILINNKELINVLIEDFIYNNKKHEYNILFINLNKSYFNVKEY